MIAKKLSVYKYINNTIIFSSGVSNSNEENKLNFQREIDLLNQYLDTEKLLMYFSSCNNIYTDKIKKSYYHHKLFIEKTIIEKSKN